MAGAVEVRLALAGPSGAGKSSLLFRQSHGRFQEDLTATIGLAFESLELSIDGKAVTISAHDTAGQERFQSLTASHLRNKHVILLVYDASAPGTWDAVHETWLELLLERADADAQVIVAANKSDMLEPDGCPVGEEAEEEQRMIDKLREHLRGHSDIRHIRVSAKSGQNVQELFEAAATLGLPLAAAEAEAEEAAQLDLAGEAAAAEKGACCGSR